MGKPSENTFQSRILVVSFIYFVHISYKFLVNSNCINILQGYTAFTAAMTAISVLARVYGIISL